MGSDPLTYHAVETIDATTSGSEQFIFSAGFGKETINGFSASGATPDTIQLAKSAFSYLTAGMTQAEDLAAVLSQATRSRIRPDDLRHARRQPDHCGTDADDDRRQPRHARIHLNRGQRPEPIAGLSGPCRRRLKRARREGGSGG